MRPQTTVVRLEGEKQFMQVSQNPKLTGSRYYNWNSQDSGEDGWEE